MDLARSAELHKLFARAAAGYGGRVRRLSRLAAALRHGPTRARRRRLMGEAIPMAHRIGDPITIASALTAAESALHAPHPARERLANAGEIVT